MQVIKNLTGARYYPWDRWFGRAAFTLRPGRDFDVSQATMAQNVRNVACRRRLRVSIKGLADGRIVVRLMGSADKGR